MKLRGRFGQNTPPKYPSQIRLVVENPKNFLGFGGFPRPRAFAAGDKEKKTPPLGKFFTFFPPKNRILTALPPQPRPKNSTPIDYSSTSRYWCGDQLASPLTSRQIDQRKTGPILTFFFVISVPKSLPQKSRFCSTHIFPPRVRILEIRYLWTPQRVLSALTPFPNPSRTVERVGGGPKWPKMGKSRFPSVNGPKVPHFGHFGLGPTQGPHEIRPCSKTQHQIFF